MYANQIDVWFVSAVLCEGCEAFLWHERTVSGGALYDSKTGFSAIMERHVLLFRCKDSVFGVGGFPTVNIAFFFG